jgi:hypothetical protein
MSPTLLIPWGADTQRPRKCAAFVVTDDVTLAIAATLRPARTRTRSPATATTPTPRPPLSAWSVCSLATGNSRDRRNTIRTIEIRLIRRLFSIIVEIIPILIGII